MSTLPQVATHVLLDWHGTRWVMLPSEHDRMHVILWEPERLRGRVIIWLADSKGEPCFHVEGNDDGIDLGRIRSFTTGKWGELRGRWESTG